MLTGTGPWQASTAVVPGSTYEVAHSTVALSGPLSVITGAEFETWTVAVDALFGAGFGSPVAEVTFAEATIVEASGAEQSESDTVASFNNNADRHAKDSPETSVLPRLKRPVSYLTRAGPRGRT